MGPFFEDLAVYLGERLGLAIGLGLPGLIFAAFFASTYRSCLFWGVVGAVAMPIAAVWQNYDIGVPTVADKIIFIVLAILVGVTIGLATYWVKRLIHGKAIGW